MEREEELSELRAAIKQLLPQQQELIYRVYFKGQTHTEIANEFGVDRSAIGHRIERALVALKKILQKNITCSFFIGIVSIFSSSLYLILFLTCQLLLTSWTLSRKTNSST